eukprot:scaffold1504_cov417-Prasinococcus_capsulatus_cf.AAC.31
MVRGGETARTKGQLHIQRPLTVGSAALRPYHHAEGWALRRFARVGRPTAMQCLSQSARPNVRLPCWLRPIKTITGRRTRPRVDAAV